MFETVSLFLGYVVVLFQLQKLCGIDLDGKVIVNDKYARIWKEILTACSKVWPCC
jgi:hypothetical protein